MSKHRERAFTLVELVVAIGIVGLMVPVLGTSIYQMNSGTARINRDFVIQQDIDRASGWLSRDLSQAESTDLSCPGQASTIRVDWIDQTGWSTPGSEAHYAKYTLSGTNLLRYYDSLTTSGIVARYVQSIQFSRSMNNFITVSITSSFGGHTENLSYFTAPRVDNTLTPACP